MGSSPPDRDDRRRPAERRELAAQLDELEETLVALRGELDTERRGPPTPPSLGELLQFTEQYSIPTLIALLEATIQSLELLRRTLRLADPGRATREETTNAQRQLDRLGTEAGEQVATTLEDLRNALSATERPSNPESQRLLEDARGLTAEIESRLRDANSTVRTARETERRNDRNDANGADFDRRDADDDADASDAPVMIDVTEDGVESAESENGANSADDADDASADAESAPEVDVDAELESIKHELGRAASADNGERVNSDDGVQATDDDVVERGRDGDVDAESDAIAGENVDTEGDAVAEDGADTENDADTEDGAGTEDDADTEADDVDQPR